MAPNTINVYAREIIGVTEAYTWEGKLHHPQGDIRCSNSRGTLDSLAQNLVSQLKTHPSPRHNQAKVSGYEINFEVGELPVGSDKSRILSLVEQIEFFEYFNKYISHNGSSQKT